MCSHNRHIKHLSCEYIGCTYASTDDGSSCTVKSGIRSLCPAETKFHDPISLCGVYNTGCLGSDQTLMVDDGQDRSFYKLCLHDRGNHFDERLSWENHTSFRNRINIPAEMESAQVMKKVFTEKPQPSQIVHIFI